jgi:hypothetical protein
MGLRALENQKKQLQDELYELHYAEPSPEMYKQRRSELEYQLACIEEQIDFEIRLKPFRVMLMGFTVVVAIVLGIYLIVKN